MVIQLPFLSSAPPAMFPRKRTLDNREAVASVFATPSATLQRILDGRVTNLFEKRPRVMPEPISTSHKDALHEECCVSDPSLERIESILQDHVMDASRRMLLRHSCTSNEADEKPQLCCESYSFPLNLAIHHQAQPQVLSRLLRAAPQILALPDGPCRETSLHVLLRSLPQCTEVVLEMLVCQPSLASERDMRGNYPLHLACEYGASIHTLQYLCIVFPSARDAKNADDKTPNDLLLEARTKGRV